MVGGRRSGPGSLLFGVPKHVIISVPLQLHSRAPWARMDCWTHVYSCFLVGLVAQCGVCVCVCACQARGLGVAARAVGDARDRQHAVRRALTLAPHALLGHLRDHEERVLPLGLAPVGGPGQSVSSGVLGIGIGSRAAPRWSPQGGMPGKVDMVCARIIWEQGEVGGDGLCSSV